MSTKAKSLYKVANHAIASEFSASTLTGTATIALESGVAEMFHESVNSDYFDEIEGIPGVFSDEGQVGGYCFQIDVDNYTPASERRLLKVVQKYKRISDKLRSIQDAVPR